MALSPTLDTAVAAEHMLSMLSVDSSRGKALPLNFPPGSMSSALLVVMVSCFMQALRGQLAHGPGRFQSRGP